jgi:beta-phosphoglucomutase-like phosphatase (HAD superfamily)
VSGVLNLRPLELTAVTTVLCDADGNLFPSEEPAFDASAGVTNAFLSAMGIEARYTAEELLRTTTGKNFRTTAADLCRSHGVAVDPSTLEVWVAEEQREVSAHLATVLRPDPAVLDPLHELDAFCTLAAVSSSGAHRLDACFAATGLDALMPQERRFSAQDSLPVPTSKPDPAIYRFALRALAVDPSAAVAVEDSPVGVVSAVAAGIPTIGNVMFVPQPDRPDRVAQLLDAGASAVIESWQELVGAMVPGQVLS